MISNYLRNICNKQEKKKKYIYHSVDIIGIRLGFSKLGFSVEFNH